MEKEEILKWVKEHDRKNIWWIEQEKEIGDRLRETKKLSKDDLKKIIEWKFESDGRIKSRELKLVSGINETFLEKVSNEVFNLDINQNMRRVMLLCNFNGIGPAVASVILTFFDPQNYCVVDFHVYQEVFGIRPKDIPVEKYLRLLRKLREEANRLNLSVREIEKAYFTKNCSKSRCIH
jgi:endonuclease III